MKRLSYEDYRKIRGMLRPEIQRINSLPISNAECSVLKDELILKHTVGTNYQADSVRYLIWGLICIIKEKQAQVL
ncbi:Uncharacterised protein [Escherichia coli]|nr:Uncharacterised protein [Escherichia coli]